MVERNVSDELARNEAVTLQAYEDAFKEGLPPQVQEIVRRQHAQVQAAHHHVHNLDATRQ